MFESLVYSEHFNGAVGFSDVGYFRLTIGLFGVINDSLLAILWWPDFIFGYSVADSSGGGHGEGGK